MGFLAWISVIRLYLTVYIRNTTFQATKVKTISQMRVKLCNSKLFSQTVKLLFLFHLLLLSCLCYAKEKVVLKVFHAGSLAVPFQRIEALFEKTYPWIDVRRESSGSVMAIRKVIDLHKPCDVIAVADYSLIPKMMFPRYADHVALFARNELVLCYTKRSKYHKIINQKNWYKILAKKDVKWGFSNPNLDPCGYRAVMCILLSELYYKAPIFKMLFETYLPFRLVKKGAFIVAEIPPSFSLTGRKLFIRPKAVELVGLLESGAIDYAIEYLSVAKQHHLCFLRLSPEINLGSLKFKDYYLKVAVVLGKKEIHAKPIVYGIAYLKTSSHPKEAKLFEEFVTGKLGAKILKESYQPPIYPAKVIKCE